MGRSNFGSGMRSQMKPWACLYLKFAPCDLTFSRIGDLHPQSVFCYESSDILRKQAWTHPHPKTAFVKASCWYHRLLYWSPVCPVELWEC